MLDSLLMDLSSVAKELLPIFGAVALYFLCRAMKSLWKLIDSLPAKVDRLDPTLNLVDQSLEKAQAPLDTVVRYSHTFDKVHDGASKAVNSAVESLQNGVQKMSDFVDDKKAGKAEDKQEETVNE